MSAICKLEDVPEGGVLRVELPDGRALAVYQWEGQFYCTDDLCSHGEASLSDGEIEDGLIVCPFHMGSFCIKTGEPRDAPCSVPIRTYRVTVSDGEIVLEN